MTPIMRRDILRDYNRLLWENLCDARVLSNKELAAAFIKYCAQHFDKREASRLKELPDYEFMTIGQYTYLALRGLVLTEYYERVIKKHYEDLIARLDSQVATVEPESIPVQGRVISIQERMREQVSGICSEWEGIVDDIMTGNKVDIDKFDAFKEMQGNNTQIKPAHARLIRESFAGIRAEIQEVLDGQDEQLNEGYERYKPKTLNKLLNFYDKILTACDTMINAGKAVRKTRKKRSPSKEKQVLKIKYKVSEPTLGLASVNPVSIVGCSQLWVYDTKKRKLGMYQSDLGSLTVKGTTIQNFDAKASVQKTIRKPEELLKGADKLARTKLQKLFDGVRSVGVKMNGRINSDMILLRVF
jgi:hypothetical protein